MIILVSIYYIRRLVDDGSFLNGILKYKKRHHDNKG